MVTHVKSGDKVKVRVEIDAKGNTFHTFQIGVTMKRTSGGTYYDLPLQGELGNGSENFTWNVPSNAEKGSYDVVCAVWEGENGGIPYNQLDKETKSNKFTVD